jgi:hypothetical protein
LTHCMRLAASRAACTAGNSSAIKTAMIAITTSNSINVKARFRRSEFMSDFLLVRERRGGHLFSRDAVFALIWRAVRTTLTAPSVITLFVSIGRQTAEQDDFSHLNRNCQL